METETYDQITVPKDIIGDQSVYLQENMQDASADRPRWQAEFDAACLPLERLFAEQPFIAGSEPRYSDYLVFSFFQWARLGSPRDVVAPGTALAEWRSRMIKRFDGLADKFPGYPERANR